jgi:hypothetical protein
MTEPSARAFAVATFVKTPGRSPLKTRLAQTVGEAAAHQFYRLACAAIAATLRTAQAASVGTIVPYWAVAEDDCGGMWSGFPVVHQGPGTLADRMNRVYSMLQAQHGGSMLIGADAPQITPAGLLEILTMHRRGADFVFGPASDGGFYLFSGQKPLPSAAWTDVEYSAPDTLEQLLPRIRNHGEVALAGTLTDVDEAKDLATVLKELTNGAASSDGPQTELIRFMQELTGTL